MIFATIKKSKIQKFGQLSKFDRKRWKIIENMHPFFSNLTVLLVSKFSIRQRILHKDKFVTEKYVCVYFYHERIEN